jgi:hypothetical protein
MKRIFRRLTIVMLTLWLQPAAEAAELTPAALVAKKVAIIELMHSKARKALVTAAQDARYRDYFTSTSEATRARLKGDIDTISLEVQSHFHVEEMCLIDPTGTEISRIVGNAIANDLDTGESDNVFFAPGFKLKPRTVYISPIYISSDADRWVQAYVTPIIVGEETKAILHYEHGLTAYQDALNKDFSGKDPFIVAVHPDGWVISDSRQSIATNKKGESENPADYFERFFWAGMSADQLKARLGGSGKGAGTIDLDAQTYDIAYAAAEQWTLFVIARR